MTEKVYTVQGSFKEKKTMKKFTKTVHANNEKHAQEHIHSQIGSEHGTKRRNIIFESVKEVKK
jgi:large subunit ribosomal protein LX